MQWNCLPSAVVSALQGVSSTLDIVTSRQSDVASCMFPSVNWRDCKIANYCLDWKFLPVQSSEAFLEGLSLVFHGHRCSHVVLCSRLIECSWGNSLVDFLMMPPLLPLPWFCLVLIFIHCAGLRGDYIYPQRFFTFSGILTRLAYFPSVLLALSLSFASSFILPFSLSCSFTRSL